MRKTPIILVVAMLLFTSQAFAYKFITVTLKNGGFESSSSYYIDVYANTSPPGDAQFELGNSFLTLIYNDTVLSDPQISDANATLQSSYTLGLDPTRLGAGFTQLQISPAGTPDFLLTENEVWLARISFTIDPTAACSGETAGIAWDNNPVHHQSDGAFLFFNGSDDSALASAPVINGTPTVSIAAGNPYSFAPNEIGGCGTLTYSIVNPPAWASFDTSTGELSGTPALADVGTTSDIVIGVSDQNSGWDELAPFDIEVTAGCAAPIISGTPTTSIAADSAYSFKPTVSNGCGTLTYSIVNPPAWASFDTATGELSGTPALADVGTTSDIVIGVSDQNSDWDELAPFDIEVTAGCAAPIISGTPTTNIAADSTYSFKPTVSNGCGVLTYSIVNQPSWASFDAATGELSGTPAGSDAGVYSDIEISVTDELLASAAMGTFDIQVSDIGSSTSNSSGGSGGGGGGGGCFIATLR